VRHRGDQPGEGAPVDLARDLDLGRRLEVSKDFGLSALRKQQKDPAGVTRIEAADIVDDVGRVPVFIRRPDRGEVAAGERVAKGRGDDGVGHGSTPSVGVGAAGGGPHHLALR
jgi:hypothetical protein